MVTVLIYFIPLVIFYNSWNHQKTKGFLSFFREYRSRPAAWNRLMKFRWLSIAFIIYCNLSSSRIIIIRFENLTSTTILMKWLSNPLLSSFFICYNTICSFQTSPLFYKKPLFVQNDLINLQYFLENRAWWRFQDISPP